MDQNNNVPQTESKGLSIASMVLGIIALVLFCIPFICFPCGIISVILGGVSLATKKGGKGMAIAGLVCSLVAILIYVILSAIGASILSSFPQ